MFKMSATTLLLMGLSLVWTSASTGQRSHYIRINRIQPEINKEWAAENLTIQIKKLNRNENLSNFSITILKDVTEEIVCEIKAYQQIGGKYLKAPAELPRTSCCKYIENNVQIWPCIRKFSNAPEKCPITKGSYEIKGVNPNECDATLRLPPNIPENYKMEFQAFKGPTRIFKLVIHGTMKKKFPVF